MGEWPIINSAQAEKFTLKNSAIFLCSSAISIPYILFFFFLPFDKKDFLKNNFDYVYTLGQMTISNRKQWVFHTFCVLL